MFRESIWIKKKYLKFLIFFFFFEACYSYLQQFWLAASELPLWSRDKALEKRFSPFLQFFQFEELLTIHAAAAALLFSPAIGNGVKNLNKMRMQKRTWVEKEVMWRRHNRCLQQRPGP